MNKIRLTDSQKLASDPTLHAWVGASAGTGKTHVLAARVLRMMLRGVPPEKILCITFTKAAAAEMQNRIHKALSDWVVTAAKNDPEDLFLLESILKHTGEEADAAMRARARTLFAEVLELPGGLQIQTIHAFCQALLGRFPVEAGLPPHFELMDERSSKKRLRPQRWMFWRWRAKVGTRPYPAPLTASPSRSRKIPSVSWCGNW